jgi:Fe2+ or Zn2+ uptake regulation protein
MSAAQKALLELLAGSHEHFTAEELFLRLKGEFPTLSLGTVYRNLEKFVQQGKIREVKRADAKNYYEGNITLHYHKCCVRCGKMSDLCIPEIDDIIRSNVGGQLISVDLTVNYICHDCTESV